MNHLFQRCRRLTARLVALPARVRTREDRGANVVETIIIVAGFAILAAGIYAAVAGKVHTWIAKMP